MGEKANAAFILEHSNAVAFRWMRGKFMCAYCPQIYPNVSEIRLHSASHKKMEIFENPEVRNSFPLKVDITDLFCSICQQAVENLVELKKHLQETHAKSPDQEYSDGIVPFVLTGKIFSCVHCGTHFEGFMSLFIHMNVHYQSFVCHTCGKSYSGKHKLRSHQKCHEIGQFPCSKCEMIFKNRVLKNRHLALVHGPKKRYRCPICDTTFDSCHARLKHLAVVHGQKSEYRCSLCPSVFGSGTSRYSHMRIVHKKQSAEKLAKPQ
ncbi:uncharacterized protein [Epargyreus clarus]|uniref:uncharacterized protein n=1 Tax=Epargyreus clarus TaxID=520877 RepID=UPI003C2D21BF